jgi:diguanylate cyclase (GGDEF)-like protein/PAS domain S-box-containing protein
METLMNDNGTILIVDDNPNNLQVLGDLLGHAGYKVRPALSGEIALRAVQLSPPDLILLDVRMPGLNGYETCQRLQADVRSREIPVIFISAMQAPEDKLAGFQAGGVDYVTKPFQAEEVLARVRAHIQLYRIQQQLESLVEARTRELAQSEARYKVLFEDSPLAIVVYDTHNLEILAVNSAFSRILGYKAALTMGRALDFVAMPQEQVTLRALARQLSEHSEEAAYTGRMQFRHQSGQVIEIEGVLQRVDYPGHHAQILMLQDVTERRQAEERLQMAAKEYQSQLEKSTHYDALTGLPNRALLTERMRQGIDQSVRTDCSMAVCFLDIDAFKPFNETHGQAVGDHLLINMAERLRSCLHGGDTLARIGGDEFVLLLPGLRSNEELDQFLMRLQARLAEPLVVADLAINLSASIGITIYPQDDAAPDTLLRHADQAMVLAKQRGKGRSQRFDPEGDKRVRVHQETVDLMRSALLRQEFVLYYQPKVNMRTGEVVGVEALIRWRHPEQGLLAPGAFLPAIEGDPFMVELGNWVIGEALSQTAHWRSQGLDLAISVNIAAQQLAQPNFIDGLREQLANHPGTAAGGLELEVLETSALDDISKVEHTICACRELGIGFSLDDFGTGYSSLTYLRRLSADTLKIDQSFVRDMLDDPEDRAIVAGIIGLAVAFKRKVIAEGVETVAHGKTLLALGCPLAQGYGIARPMPAQDLPIWVTTWPNAAWQAVTQPN